MGNLLAICDKPSIQDNIPEEVLLFGRHRDSVIVKTEPYADQNPGTSGLRKKTKVFMQKHYLHNFVQSIFNVLGVSKIKNQSLLIASDGRFFYKEAIQIICEIAAANGITHIIIPKNGIATTPACSVLIRKRNRLGCFDQYEDRLSGKKKTTIRDTHEQKSSTKCSKDGEMKCLGGILLTASHNPGGENEDFGVKINTSDGGAASEDITNKIFEETKKINMFKLKRLKQIKYNEIKTQTVENITIEVVNPITDWLHLMKQTFDFELIKKLTLHKKFILAYDGFHGSTGEYAKELFLNELQVSGKFLFHLNSKPDFNKMHPDPNLVHAEKLVELMKVNMDEEESSEKDEQDDEVIPDIAGICDADGDRCMILGKQIFVNSCDNLAIIAHYAAKCIPHFKTNYYGVARSLPTSPAVDRVMKKFGKEVYETPTGWKYFVSLMETNKISLCGEESFGVGCNLIREKDGLFCILCWLSILAYKNFVENDKKDSSDLIGVKETVHEFWKEYGRYYYIRYDFENVEAHKCCELFEFLDKLVVNKSVMYEEIKDFNWNDENNKVLSVESFAYVDCVTKHVSKNQGIRIKFANDASVIYRKSGTASTNATIRIYFQKFEKDNIFASNKKVLEKVIINGLKMCKIKEFIGTDVPSVIT